LFVYDFVSFSLFWYFLFILVGFRTYLRNYKLIKKTNHNRVLSDQQQ